MELKLDKLAWSEWGVPLHVCTRINPISVIQNQNIVSDCFKNQVAHVLSATEPVRIYYRCIIIFSGIFISAGCTDSEKISLKRGIFSKFPDFCHLPQRASFS